MGERLKHKRVAVLVADGFEQVELTSPVEALKTEGAEVDIISLKPGKVCGFHHMEKGEEFDVTLCVQDAKAEEYSALLLPGGVFNPDALRANQNAVSFANSFFDAGKPIAAICHGPQTLIETNGLKGRTVTSFPSVKTDLKNAGASWVDKEVVVDQGLVTSRSPDDLPAFNAKMVEEFCEGEHRRRKTA